MEKVFCSFAFPRITALSALLFESLSLLLKNEWGFNSFLSSLFPLWFIVWKSTRRFYPSVYTQVCIWKSCSEEGKRANKQSCWEWGSGTQQLWVKVLHWGLGSIFLWLCFLWDWWGGWCFWENGAVRGERLCVQVDRVSTQGMSRGGGSS